MLECHLETSVTDWVIEHPVTLPLFQSLQIDHHCGGKSLEFACRERNLDPQAVMSKIQELLEKTHGADDNPEK